MKFIKRNGIRKLGIICIAGIAVFTMVSCGGKGESDNNLIIVEKDDERVVNLFSPMEKTEANVENVARSATDKTILMAEEKLGLRVAYVTYTAEDYQDKTYDDVALDRAGLCQKPQGCCEGGQCGGRQTRCDPAGGCGLRSVYQ